MEATLSTLEAGLDKYIRDQRECGNPARYQDVVDFCRLTGLPSGEELARVGHLLEPPRHNKFKYFRDGSGPAVRDCYCDIGRDH